MNPLTALVLSGSRIGLAPAKSKQGNDWLRCSNRKVTSSEHKKVLKVIIQADFDFIDFLLGLLMVPLGKVEWSFGSNTGLKAMDNLHRSLTDHSNKVYDNHRSQPSLITSQNRDASIEFLNFNFEPHADNRLLKQVGVYMVSDDLTVAPFAMSSCLSVFNGLGISLSDVEELELEVGLQEGLNIVKAALTSTTALTDGLMKPAFPASNSGLVNKTSKKVKKRR